MNDLLLNIKKEFRVELRSRYAAAMAVSFAFAIVLVEGLVSHGRVSDPFSASVLLWITCIFPLLITLPHSFFREIDEGTIIILQSRYGSDSVLLSKLIFNSVLALATGGVVILLYVLILNLHIVHLSYFTAVCVFGLISLSCSTAFAAALASMARGRGPLFAIISFPLITPPLTVAVHSAADSFRDGITQSGDIIFLAGYSFVMAGISIILYRNVWNC